jgi:hypothetical protein
VRAGHVPTARIAPVLRRLISDRWPHGGGLDVLAEKVGCNASTIEGILAQDYPGLSFYLADDLFCALGRPMEDVGLADIYWNTELVEKAALDVSDFPIGGLFACGHEMSPQNAKPEPRIGERTYWRCRTCANERRRKNRLAKAAA